VDNRTLRLPERARNQMPRGIGQLSEQTLRNTNHIGDDKRSDYSSAVAETGKTSIKRYIRLDLA
jgi:hypothetical protein